MPDVEPVIPVGEKGPPKQVAEINEALRDLSNRFREVDPECVFSVLCSFVLTACAAQARPKRALAQLMTAVSDGLDEIEGMPAVGTS